MNRYEHDETPIADEDRRLCGCGHPQCWLLESDPTNVQVGPAWYAADCAGLCWNCGQVDTLVNLFPVGSGRLVHDGCLKESPEVTAALEQQLRADEARDAFEQRRR